MMKNNDTEAGMFCVSLRVILSELKAFPMRSKLRVYSEKKQVTRCRLQTARRSSRLDEVDASA